MSLRLTHLGMAGLCAFLAFLLQPLGNHRDANGDALYWIDSARTTHARFTGRPGTFAQFGDSITVTQAFWTPLLSEPKNAPPQMARALAAIKSTMRAECWRDWKGPEYGSEGGQTSRWAAEHIDAWLKKLNPEVVLVMFGSNDLSSTELDEYRSRMRSVVRKCLDNGSVVILSTIPPRHGLEKKTSEFSEAVRQIAIDMKIPLTDFHAEILKHRPGDWDGALDRFKSYEGYEVPTLISRDGVHPSFPKQYQNDYSDEGLSRSGYTLRNCMVLLQYAEVIDVLRSPPKTEDRCVEPAASEQRWPAWFPKAPPLPAPSGEVVRVSTADELIRATEMAQSGQTILIEDGRYVLSLPIEIKADRVTLRGASGHRDRVILDGEGTLGEMVRITSCGDVTVSGLTVQNVRWNGIKINSETNVQRLTIYDCVLHNIWQRAIKGVKVPEKDREAVRPAGIRIQYCLFYNDHPKRFADDASDTMENFKGNYIGGVDTMFPRGWTISDNVFAGIHGRTKEARGAVFLWHDAQDCIVERNVIIDCDQGICLGNSSLPEDVKIHCTRCIVRNNFVTRASENGILGDYTRDCRIVNNSVFDPDSSLQRLIRLVHSNEGMLVANNLLAGPPVRIETSSKIDLRANLESAPSSYFVDPANGNLHLTAAAAGARAKAVPLAEVAEDIDRRRRGRMPDIGAHERGRD